MAAKKNSKTSKAQTAKSESAPKPEAEQRSDPIKPRPKKSPTPVKSTSTTPAKTPPADVLSQPSGASTGTPKNAPAASAPSSGLMKKLSRNVEGQHLIVEALAGTGKTTTLIEGLKRLRGLTPAITPSTQQAAVWDELCKSRPDSKVCFVAFNKAIATELQSRVPAGVEAMTMHSLGYKVVKQVLGYQEPTSFAVQDVIARVLETDIRQLRKDKPVVIKMAERLVALCKQNLMQASPEELMQLVEYFDLDLEGYDEEVFNLVPKVLDECLRPAGKISFDDMIWLPVVLGLSVPRYDVLLVDEAQDLNRCQQALAKMAGERLVFVGDRHQSIYGFAGADSQSLPRLASELALTQRGCVVLPLTVTRRCGRKIVEEAQRYVPEFTAHESNKDGVVNRAKYPKDFSGSLTDYQLSVAQGDHILCRTNAPLVSQCFQFIRAGRKAIILGRDIGEGLISLAKKCWLPKDGEGPNVVTFIEHLERWHDGERSRECAKKFPSESRLQAFQDRLDCMLAFSSILSPEDVGDVGLSKIISRIEAIFTDDKHQPGIRMSSIHKAKGLEAKRVFWLMSDGVRPFGPPLDKIKQWEAQQERNLAYVAITRAIEELVYVGS